MVGTYAGARLALRLSGPAQLAIFALVIATAAAFMFRQRAPSTVAQPSATPARRPPALGLPATIHYLTGALRAPVVD